MPESLKKRPKLSVKMQLLKDNIHALTRERKSLMEQVYEGGKFASVVVAGINKVFSVFASFLSSFSAIPLIGNFFYGLAAIPEGIVFFSDPKKTIKEKLISAAAIIVVGGIALTAVILGTIPTLIFSTAVAAFFALLEGLNVTNRYFHKQQVSKSYNERNEFVNLVASRKIPEGDKFNELLEIRAVELEHDIDRPGIGKSIRKGMQAELDFINDELNKRNISKGHDPENKASQLAQLYKIHKEQIQVLTDVLSLITSETELEGNQEVLDDIQKLQNEILTTEADIISITQPINLLKFDYALASPKLAISLTNLGITSTGTAISVIALLMGIGTIVAPPIFFPVMVGVGITLAVVGLGKWIIEKMTEQEEKQFKTQNEINKKDIILNEALIAYEQKNSHTQSASLGNSSHSKHLLELLGKTPRVKSEPNTAHSDSIPYQKEFRLFNRNEETPEVELELIEKTTSHTHIT